MTARLAGDSPLWQIWQSMTQLPSLLAADRIGLFAALDSGPMSLEGLARALDLEVRPVRALADYMTALTLLERSDDGSYGLTDTARAYLLPESPSYWGELFDTFRRGTTTEEAVLMALRKRQSDAPGGSGVFDTFEQDEAKARRFSYSMARRGRCAAHELQASTAFRGVNRLLDVAGGLGHFSAALVSANPDMAATVIDLPQVCKLGRDYLDREWREGGANERVSFDALDMFNAPWPSGIDGVFFADVFHDWAPDTCRTLARKAHQALAQGGKIFLLEFLTDNDRTPPWLVESYNLAVLFYTEGQQFSFAQLTSLLEAEGFASVKQEPAGDIYTLVIAEKT